MKLRVFEVFEKATNYKFYIEAESLNIAVKKINYITGIPISKLYSKMYTFKEVTRNENI